MNTNYLKKIPLQGKLWFFFFNLNEFFPICHHAYNKFTQEFLSQKEQSCLAVFTSYGRDFACLFGILFCFYCGWHGHIKYSSLAPNPIPKTLYFLHFNISTSWGRLRIVRKLVTEMIIFTSQNKHFAPKSLAIFIQ